MNPEVGSQGVGARKQYPAASIQDHASRILHVASPIDRVLLITNIPTPYRIPLFNELNVQLATIGISFKVVFAALGYPRRKWEIDMTCCSFPWEVLNSARLPSRNPESAVFTYSGLGRILRSEKGALVIVGGFSFATTRLWLRSLFRCTTYLVWSGAIVRQGSADSWLHRWRRRRLVARARGFIAYGTSARNYLISLGAPPHAVSIGVNTVDAEFFCREAQRLRLTLPGNGPKRILYVGNLEKGKRIDLLLRAVARLSETRDDFIVELVGSGSQEKQLRQLAVDLDVGSHIEFLGFRQRDQVVEHLAQASCFTFPSDYDIWGLVLVEAMASGLVCLASINAGATHDLIRDGVTGFAVNFEDTEAVVSRLRWVLDHPEESHKIGHQAESFIRENVSTQASAAGFVGAIEKVLVNC